MYQYTNTDIQNRTGLKVNFINKVNSRLSDVLSPFRIAGDNGKILYDESGLKLWDTIKQEKERGANIPQIKEKLRTIVQPDRQTNDSPDQPSEPAIQPSQTAQQDDLRFWVESLKDAYTTALAEKDKRLLLLEEGRGEREEREAHLQEQVKTLNTKITTEDERRRQRKALYSKLATLNGWGKGKQREAVLKEIEVLDAL